MLAAQDNLSGSCNSFRQSKPVLQQKSLASRNDFDNRLWHTLAMAKPLYDWYLKEWLATLGKKQADIARDLEWNKARVSLMLRGDQQYNRDAINELVMYLNLKPYELLMHPQDAMALRRLQKTAIEIAHSVEDDNAKVSKTA